MILKCCDTEPVVLRAEMPWGDLYCVRCYTCDTSSPQANTEESAVEHWNFIIISRQLEDMNLSDMSISEVVKQVQERLVR